MDKTVWERLKNHKVEGKTEEEKASIEEAKKKDFQNEEVKSEDQKFKEANYDGDKEGRQL